MTGNEFEQVRVFDGNDDHVDAIQISGGSIDTVINGNHIHDGTNAIIVGSARLMKREGLTIENNLIHDMTTHCLNIYDTQRLVIRQNTCWDTGYGLWLGDEEISPDTHTTGARVYNNVLGPATNYPTAFSNRISKAPDWGSEDHNMIAEHSEGQTLDPTDLTPPAQELEPLLVNVQARDLSPRPGGGLIDAGSAAFGVPFADLRGQPRLLGHAPDIGAYEVG